MKKASFLLIIGSLSLAASVYAADDSVGPAPLFTTSIVSATITAINYHNLRGSTKVGFEPLRSSSKARGEAIIKGGDEEAVTITANFDGLESPARFGPGYLTYVLWAIAPDHSATNLTECLVKDGKSRIRITTPVQNFGLLLTAEAHYATGQPSDAAVLQNVVTDQTKGKIEQMDARYTRLPVSYYSAGADTTTTNAPMLDQEGLFYLAQARNSIRLAKQEGAETYATQELKKAQEYLDAVEQSADKSTRQVINWARQAVEQGETVRQIAMKRRVQNMILKEKTPSP